MSTQKNNNGLLVVISGPSGAGKTSICRRLVEHDDVVPSVSMTTRKPRPGEVDGQDYYFTDEEDFRRKIDQGYFLEWARVFDRYYGTPQREVDRAVEAGKICLLEIDVQGGVQVIEKVPEVVSIFIEPPSFEAVVRRLTDRDTESEAERERRLKEYEKEMDAGRRYAHHVVNDHLDEATATVWTIICQARR